MTTLHSPFAILRETIEGTVAETTAMEVSAAGSARFSGPGVTITGTMAVVGNIAASGNASVSGQIDSGAGTVVLEQSATVAESMTAATQLVSLPNSRLHDVLYKRINVGGFSTAAATINIHVGTSADEDQFGTFPNVSAQAIMSLTEDGTNVSGNTMHFVASQGVFVRVTAASGAVSGALGNGLLTFVYSRR